MEWQVDQTVVCASGWLIPDGNPGVGMPDTPASLALPLPAGLERPVAGLVAAVRTVAFWLAVALPVVYPVALLSALETLPLLLAGHAVAVALGHGHRPGRDPRPGHGRQE